MGSNCEGGLVIGDVTGDRVEDVVFAGVGANTSSIYVLNGRDGKIISSWNSSRIGIYCQPQLYDVDGDGRLDILVPLYYLPGLVALKYDTGSKTLVILWIVDTEGATGSGSVMSKPVAGDIDGDGHLDIFIASQDVSPLGGYDGTILRIDYQGHILAKTFSWRPCSGGLSLADTDNDGVFELYQGDRSMSYGDGGYGKGERSYWADNLTIRWTRLDIMSSSQSPVLADVNGDGILDVVTGMYREVNVLDSSNGKWIYHYTSSTLSDHYGFTVYDIDGDGHLEVLCDDGDHDNDRYTDVFDLVTGKMDKQLSLSGGDWKWSPLVADIDPNTPGMEVISCPNGTTLDNPNGTDWYGAIMVWSNTYKPLQNVTRDSSGNHLSSQLGYPIVQDIDGDGLLELVTETSTGRVYAFDTAAPAPTGSNRIRSEVTYYGENRLGVAQSTIVPGEAGYWSAPLVAPVYPTDNSLAVSRSASQLSFKVRSEQSRALTYSVATSPNIGSVTGSINNGTYDWTAIALRVSGLAYDTTYRYTISASDGSRTTSRTYSFQTEMAPTTDNSPPTQGYPTLFPSTADTTTELTCTAQQTSDPNGNPVTNIYRWTVDGDPAARLLLPFDTRSSTSTKDYSGFGNNGLVIGATWVPNGRVGGAYSFDGKDDAIVVSDGGAGYYDNKTYSNNNEERGGFGDWSAVTVEAWIYLTSNNLGSIVVGKIPSYSLGFVGGSTNRLSASVWTMGYNISTTDDNRAYTDKMQSVTTFNSTQLRLNTWYHVAFSYQSGVGLKLYLNGQLVGWSSVITGPVKESRGEPIYIGRLNQPFRGMIDEVKIYDYALPDAQIYSSYIDSRNGSSAQSTFLSIGAGAVSGVVGCDVTPTDSYADGATHSVSTAPWLNHAPNASSLNIYPVRSAPYRVDGEDLTAGYVYIDSDKTPESGTQIRWYMNGILQPSFNNVPTITESSTATGQTWYFTVLPKDSLGAVGDLQTSSNVTIRGDSAPITGIPTLNSANGGRNYGDKDLICTSAPTVDEDNDATTNIYRWTNNWASITNLQMPFDTEIPSYLNSKGVTRDYSGYGNNGVVNATWTPNGVIGGALSFDGNDYVTVQEHSNSLGGSGDWSQISVELWVRASAIANSIKTIVFKPDALYSPSTTFYSTGYRLQYRANDGNYMVYWSINNGSGLVTLSQRVYADPLQWHHVVVTYQSGVGLQIYSDGALMGTLNATGNIYATPGGLLYIGGINGVAGDFSGQLDEVRIYPKALSAAQVLQRYKDTLNGCKNETVVAREVASGEAWACQVTPNDAWGDGAPQQSAILNILKTNGKPTIDWFSPANSSVAINEGDSLRFTQKSSDPNGDALTYSWTLDASEVAAAQNWTYSPSLGSQGIHGVRVTVSDGDLTDYREWTVSVSSVPPKHFALSLNVAGNGTVSKNPDLPVYNASTVITLTAVPADGWAFASWSGAVSGTDLVTIVMDSNKTVKARFLPLYSLNITISGDGEASPVSGAYKYMQGTKIKVDALSNAGSEFGYWLLNGRNIGGTGSCNLTLYGNTRIVAVFLSEVPFVDGFESDSFTRWSDITVTSGETASVVGTLYHDGAFSGMFTTNGDGGVERAYVSKLLLPQSELYVRAYFYIDSGLPLQSKDSRFNLFAFQGANGTIANLSVRRNSNGVDTWAITSPWGTWSAASSLVADKWYCVEFYAKLGSIGGNLTMWVDGVRVLSKANLDTASMGSIVAVNTGLCYVTNTTSPVRVYSDSCAISDTYIGPIAGSWPSIRMLVYNLEVDGKSCYVSVASASQVSNFSFSMLSKVISFDVFGATDAVGFLNVTVPTVQIGGPYRVLIDGSPITQTQVSNATCTSLYFTYPSGAHKIEIQSASTASTMSLAVPLIAIAVAALIGLTLYLRRNRLARKNQPNN